MKHPFIGISLGFFGAVLIASSASAQGRGGTFFNPPNRTPGTFFNAPQANGFMHGPGATHFRGRVARRSHFRHLYAYPYGYAGYWPYDYSDSDYDDGASDELAPQPRSAAPSKPAEAPRPADSVVVELRGDHWVRLTSTGPVEVLDRVAAPNTANAPNTNTKPAVLPAFDSSPVAAPLPAAILIFHDGHEEEATSYTIVGRAIYLKSDYWSAASQNPSQSPSWTRKVQIADLDIPATLKLNHERGTKFALPSRPSEIILRP